MDDQNPAIRKHTSIHPQLLESVLDDPAAAATIFRAQAVQQMHELHVLRDNLTPAQRMQLAELAAKLGDMVPKKLDAAAQPGSGFVLNINIPNMPTQRLEHVIEAESSPADE